MLGFGSARAGCALRYCWHRGTGLDQLFEALERLKEHSPGRRYFRTTQMLQAQNLTHARHQLGHALIRSLSAVSAMEFVLAGWEFVSPIDTANDGTPWGDLARPVFALYDSSPIRSAPGPVACGALALNVMAYMAGRRRRRA